MTFAYGRSRPGIIVALVPYLNLWFLVLHLYFIQSENLTGHTGLELVACLELCWLHSFGLVAIKLTHLYLVTTHNRNKKRFSVEFRQIQLNIMLFEGKKRKYINIFC